jgi:hypothetical protein
MWSDFVLAGYATALQRCKGKRLLIDLLAVRAGIALMGRLAEEGGQKETLLS